MKKKSDIIVIDKNMRVRLLQAIKSGVLNEEEFPQLLINNDRFIENIKENGGYVPDELLNFKMRVEIDKSIKVRLLQAIQAGELDRNLFPEFTIQPTPFIELMMKSYEADE